MRRIVAVTVLCLVLVSVVAAQTGRPGVDHPTTLRESLCYDCHSTGGGSYGPALSVMYLIHGPEALVVPVGEQALLEVALENAWVAELQDIVAVANLENAPFLRFAGDLEPFTQTLTGTVEAAGDTAALEGRYATTTFQVEPGTTELAFTLQGNGEATDPQTDFRLYLWPPGHDTDGEPAIEVNEAPAGEPETYQIMGAQAVSALGTGEWTAGIAVPGAANDPAGALSHPYSLDVFSDFSDAEAVEQFTSVPGVMASRNEAPGQLIYLGWNIRVDTLPEGPTTLPVRVELNAHFDHVTQATDDWIFTKTVELQVIPDPASDAVIIRANSVAERPSTATGFAWDTLSEVVGYISAILVLASIYTGGMFGKTSRRQLNTVFGTAKRRVAFHNFLSYAILLTAVAHTVIFLFEPGFDWTLGILWGGIAILAMIGLGVTGALQVPMIRKWNYATWRWSHFYLAIGTIVFTIVHILLDGVHFATVQEAVGWTNPFVESV